MAERLFDRGAILENLRALADRLTASKVPHQSIVLIGGSYMALRDLRESTRDVDTITHLNDAMQRAISAVAREKGLGPRWLNDHAVAFRPDGLSMTDCTPII